MRQIRTAAIWLTFVGAFLLSAAGANAQTAPSGTQVAQTSPANEADRPVRVHRSPRRVYPRYFPGRNAVRDCTATYVQEFRPSGTVIVPRMNCYWRPG
jgi:hypothetical protein